MTRFAQGTFPNIGARQRRDAARLRALLRALPIFADVGHVRVAVVEDRALLVHPDLLSDPAGCEVLGMDECDQSSLSETCDREVANSGGGLCGNPLVPRGLLRVPADLRPWFVFEQERPDPAVPEER